MTESMRGLMLRMVKAGGCREPAATEVVEGVLDVLQEPSEAAFVAADCFSTDEGAHEAKDFWRSMIAAIREGK